MDLIFYYILASWKCSADNDRIYEDVLFNKIFLIENII